MTGNYRRDVASGVFRRQREIQQLQEKNEELKAKIAHLMTSCEHFVMDAPGTPGYIGTLFGAGQMSAYTDVVVVLKKLLEDVDGLR